MTRPARWSAATRRARNCGARGPSQCRRSRAGRPGRMTSPPGRGRRIGPSPAAARRAPRGDGDRTADGRRLRRAEAAAVGRGGPRGDDDPGGAGPREHAHPDVAVRGLRAGRGLAAATGIPLHAPARQWAEHGGEGAERAGSAGPGPAEPAGRNWPTRSRPGKPSGTDSGARARGASGSPRRVANGPISILKSLGGDPLVQHWGFACEPYQIQRIPWENALTVRPL